jgi:hypothetical protein
VTQPLSGLTEKQRSALERTIISARKLLEEDLASQAEGLYGIHKSGKVDQESSLRLDPSSLQDRREIVGVVDHLVAEGETAKAAVTRFIREASFTHLNRLVAIRVGESIGFIPESLKGGRQSQGFKDFKAVAPLVSKDETGGFWIYLRLLGDELASDAPQLFDPRNPLLALAPSPKAVDQLVPLLSSGLLDDAWRAPDAFGWTYQFFNTQEERREMREGSPAPKNTRELAVRNQFFTPRYVVDFLVQNTLGRRLLESDPTSELKEHLSLLVDPPSEQGKPLDLEQVRILDPACGSGHFLIGCYDLLEKAWEAKSVTPEDAAERIIPCLVGIDIDPRCAQVASAALILRARRHRRDGELPSPQIITARALPADAEAWQSALAELPKERHGLIAAVRDALTDAPILGPLLKVEERLADEIRKSVPHGAAEEGTLFEAMDVATDAFGKAEAEVLTALSRVADASSSTPAERLLAAEAEDAIRFVEAVRARYDVVLMNPPFGEPVPETKAYLKSAYEWMPTKDANLLAAFVGRGVELLAEAGYVGAITSRAGMFLSTFESWRRNVLLGHELMTLADLGHGVMEQALVEAAAYVLSERKTRPDHEATFIRLLKDTNRPRGLAEAVAKGPEDRRVFRVRLAELDAVPGAPLAYWMHPEIRRLFEELPPLEGNGAEVRQGLATADDFRFVRAFWEVNPRKIGRSREETLKGKRWVPFAKGGEYSPFWADIHLVVDWENDGKRLREFSGSVIRNEKYYFRSGLTWNKRTTSGFSPQVFPPGCIFSVQGLAAITPNEDLALVLLSTLNDRVVRVVLDSLVAAGEATTSGTAARHYEVGLIQRLPWPGGQLSGARATKVQSLTRDVISTRARFDEYDETSRRFVCPQALHSSLSSIVKAIQDGWDSHEEALTSAIDGTLEIERALHEAIGLSKDCERFLDEEYGPHPATFSSESMDDEDEFVRLYESPIDQVIGEIVQTRGGARVIATKSYFLDRRLEMLAHLFDRHPSTLAEIRKRQALLPPGELEASAADLLSYLVGCALGRWDVRIGRDRELAPTLTDAFDLVPLGSPGMLVGDDGFPADAPPSDYPLDVPPGRLLLDEEGHPQDIEACVRAVAQVLFDDPDAIITEAIIILEAKSLREYLRRQFFKEHLSRYSKSRRKAPIYCQLSVPSKKWGVWAYAPFISREMLFVIAREAARRERTGEEKLRALRQDLDKGLQDRRRLLKMIDEEESLLAEVKAFREEADRVAGLGWEPDLDDGIVLCAAPLAKLFPAWKEPRNYLKELRQGKYPWATVSKWADKL